MGSDGGLESDGDARDDGGQDSDSRGGVEEVEEGVRALGVRPAGAGNFSEGDDLDAG